MTGERIDPPAQHLIPTLPLTMLGARRWTRRRLLARLAAGLGAALMLPPGLPTDAHELGPIRRACACGGSRVTARESQAVGPERAIGAKPGVRAFENRIGWAYSPRWRKSRAEVVADLRRMRDLGCNTIYIGHNSAGNTDPDAYEPGLAPANWYAIAAATPSSDDAHIVVAAVSTALDAAREVGLDVVLGIGYQIMMGDEWNDAHPEDLRRNRHGALLKHWGSVFTASPYSEVYRRDIGEYYGWVNRTFVLPHPHVVALNLADEPMGADFSSHAMSAFEARYGVAFDAASNAQRGEFLSGVIADYAAWSASFWERLNPDVRTMMTFHVQRDAPFLPDVERLFAQTPPSFIFSEDTHLDDGLIDRAITPTNVRLLYGMCRTFGWLSQVYARPLMLWTSANAWGLKRKGGLAEARLNLEIVHDATRQAGGQIGMLMAWGWNIRFQGVYDDEGNFGADKEAVIAGVSQMLSAQRERLSIPSTSRPDRVHYVPSARLMATIGERRFDHLAEGVVDLSRIDFATENAVYLTDGRALEEARRLGIPITPL
jgi:hypothetical protein